jgi:CBS domain-containing protein
MRAMTAADVMTRDVITVGPQAPFKEIVDILVENGVSAVPVVDGRREVLGVVSEADLLRKEEHADDEPTAGPSVLTLPHVRARWRKAAAVTARELMTSPAHTVSPEAEVPNVARLLARLRVRRFFVVDGAGRLVGVVARRDLLRGFQRADDDIRREIEREVFGRVLWAIPGAVSAEVADGIVTLSGQLDFEADVDIAGHLVKAMPGVVGVRNRLSYRWLDEADHARTW